MRVCACSLSPCLSACLLTGAATQCTARLSRSVRGLGSANVTVAPTAMDLLRGAVQEDQDEDVLRALERVNAMVKPLPPAPRSKPAPPPAKAKRDLPPSPPPQPVVRCDGSEPHPAPPDDPCHGKPPAQLAAEARAMQAAIEQASVAAMAERQRRWLAEARAIFKRFSGPDGSWTRGNRVGVHDLNLDVAAAAAAVSAPVHRA